LDKHGEPVVDYPLGEHERRQLTQGTLAGIRLHLAAGATRMGTLHARLTTFDAPADGSDALDADALRAFLREVEARGLEPNRVMLFSAHQMGTCRMAADVRRGVIGPDNQIFGVRGLFVADGAAFPTASGVNPMLTILAIAHRAAQAVKASF
jgi:choline dehydrogenase-like flavoprotein